MQSAIRVLFGDRNHEAQVCLDHFFLRTASFCLANRHLPVDFFDLADRQQGIGFDAAQLALCAQNVIFEFRENGRVFALRANMLVDPGKIRLALRETREEIFARHASITNADAHNEALLRANNGHDTAQISHQGIKQFRRKLKLHELIR